MFVYEPQLLLGDCLDRMRQIPDGAVDLVLCDPPYGTTACSWDSVIPLSPMWESVRRVLTPRGTAVFTSAQPFSSALMAPSFGLFKHASVWVKNRPIGPQHAKNRPMSKHEDVLVFSKGKMGHAVQLGDRRMTYNPQGVRSAGMKTVTAKGSHSRLTGPRPNQVGREYEAMTGFPHTILEFDKEEAHLHPTQKPVALMEVTRFLISQWALAQPAWLAPTQVAGSSASSETRLTSRSRRIGSRLRNPSRSFARQITIMR
jgi:site-specific DNA-methyltransferase (adenine-specific)